MNDESGFIWIPVILAIGFVWFGIYYVLNG